MEVSIVAGAKSICASKFEGVFDSSEKIIAADGGANHCFELDIRPDLIVGDLDSIFPGVLEDFSQQSEVKKFPKDKDQTDFSLALNEALQMGASRLNIFAWADQRFDYCLDILLSLVGVEIPTKLYADEFNAYCLNSKNSPLKLSGLEPGQKISFNCIRAPLSLKSDELKWPLDWKSMPSNTRSQSNRALGGELVVTVSEGDVLCLLEDASETAQ